VGPKGSRHRSFDLDNPSSSKKHQVHADASGEKECQPDGYVGSDGNEGASYGQ
jgi:hypothetical protein